MHRMRKVFTLTQYLILSKVMTLSSRRILSAGASLRAKLSNASRNTNREELALGGVIPQCTRTDDSRTTTRHSRKREGTTFMRCTKENAMHPEMSAVTGSKTFPWMVLQECAAQCKVKRGSADVVWKLSWSNIRMTLLKTCSEPRQKLLFLSIASAKLHHRV